MAGSFSIIWVPIDDEARKRFRNFTIFLSTSGPLKIQNLFEEQLKKAVDHHGNKLHDIA